MSQHSIITVNATQCGGGKTTGDIYPRIRNLIAQGQLVMAVVPGVIMAQDYKTALPEATMIVSNGQEGVDKRLISAIAHRDSCIVITHTAFLQHVWSRMDREAYNLIIDEAFEPFKFVRYKVDKTTEIKTQFQLQRELLKGNWWMTTTPAWRDHAAYRESESYRHLSSNNWFAWQSLQDNENLHAGKWAEFGLELGKGAVFDWWPTIHIAAAKFEDTFLAAWVRKEGLVWRRTHEFEPHANADIVWHTFDFKWSKTLREASPELHEQYRDYVNAQAGSNKIIALRNSDSNRIKLNNETRIDHNCHGQNNLREYTHVSIESSLNLHPEHVVWLADILEMTPEQIKRARTTYTHYQAIMRCVLRTQATVLDPVHIFSCDSTVTAQLLDYFDGKNPQLKTIPNTYQQREPALTTAERMRVMRYRRSHPEHIRWTARQILDNRSATDGLKPSLSEEAE